jgi:hypothetical protein
MVSIGSFNSEWMATCSECVDLGGFLIQGDGSKQVEVGVRSRTQGPRDLGTMQARRKQSTVDRSQGSAEWAGAKFRILHFTRSFESAAHSGGRTLRVLDGRGLARTRAVGVGRGRHDRAER